MSLIIKRQGVGGKGSPLTSSEIDNNVNNLNNDKVETANSTFTGTPSLVDNLIPLSGTVLPAIYPTLNLDFANSQTLDPRITFARSSTATYTDKTGLVKLAPANIPRFDFDPINRKCLGLLIEEGRTNLLVNSTIDGANLATQNITTTAAARTLSFYGSGSVALSGRVNLLTKTEDFSDAVWTKNVVGTGVLPVVTLNAGIAPDGTSTAAQVVFNTGAGTTASDISLLEYYQISKATIGVSYTSGVWIKGVIGQKIQIRQPAASGYTLQTLTGNWDYFTQVEISAVTVAIMDIGLRQSVNGTINSNVTVLLWHPDLRPTNTTNFLPAYQRVNTTTDFTPATATIVGLGAYPTRTTYTYTPTAGTLTVTVSGTVQYANDELGSFATSFMPTAGTSFSRQPDTAVMTGVNFSSWYNQAEFSVYWESSTVSNAINGIAWQLSNVVAFGYNNNALGNSRFTVYGSPTANINGGAIVAGSTNKYSMSVKGGGNLIGVVNGVVQGNIAAPATINIASAMAIYDANNGAPVNVIRIKKITYYPKALSSSELVGLTR